MNGTIRHWAVHWQRLIHRRGRRLHGHRSCRPFIPMALICVLHLNAALSTDVSDFVQFACSFDHGNSHYGLANRTLDGGVPEVGTDLGLHEVLLAEHRATGWVDAKKMSQPARRFRRSPFGVEANGARLGNLGNIQFYAFGEGRLNEWMTY